MPSARPKIATCPDPWAERLPEGSAEAGRYSIWPRGPSEVVKVRGPEQVRFPKNATCPDQWAERLPEESVEAGRYSIWPRGPSEVVKVRGPELFQNQRTCQPARPRTLTPSKGLLGQIE